MPKDEFDFQDPFELNGMALLTEEDTIDPMCECFIEEFMRMGHSADHVLELFCNPQHLGMNMVLEQRGEPFIRDRITEVFARWGRSAVFQTRSAGPDAGGPPQPATLQASRDPHTGGPAAGSADSPIPHPTL